MKIAPLIAVAPILIGLAAGGPAFAQDALTLTSPEIASGAALPGDLKCSRDNGDGVSPPLAWTNVPEATQSLALIMFHYPKGTVEGVNPPSQYWLLWNIPPNTTAMPRGNPASVGDEGSDKDGNATGYTPPCSPKPWFSFSSKPEHEYFIELFALSAPLETLPSHDDLSVNWAALTTAMAGKVIASSRLSFWN
ncbi:phospholipid-binding protein, PBP family [Pseudorhodobacter antarcticus]|uniref:Phospholipid-binding protein, PBP family n=1 Tax=Pseudorhodobacter antarcticus TaxID=1077947 RepID=A0A1H8LFZ4_9RHOB|nr:YbhB/YbcL family Raf kinase inhibitor-like protein [Pseudorhodobacter antarcticus]SEO04080.1 phospholipid-binding protein, PBP family [Pseudorhodobacter antarcticus]